MDLNSNTRKRSPKPKIALNKSASFSGSPIAQKYEIKHLFRSKDGETYLQHYSYEVSGKKRPYHNHKYTKPSSPKNKPIITSSDYFSTPYEGGTNKKSSNVKFGTPFDYLFTFAKHIKEEKGFTNTLNENVIPMEIDSSFDKTNIVSDNASKIISDKSMTDVHQINDLNNQAAHQCKVPKLVIKPKKSIDVIKNSKIKQSKNVGDFNRSGGRFLIRLINVFVLFFVPVLIGVFFMHYKTDSTVIETFDSEPIVNDLKNRLYGQDQVIKQLEYNLNIIKNNKIFIFSGGTGVGKTYAAKLIEKNFPYKNNIQKIYPWSKKEHYHSLEKRIENNLEKNSQNLIIMDSLTLDDIYNILPIINNLSYIQTKFILILIFNLQDDSINPLPLPILKIKSNEIGQIFYDNNISCSLFIFENLNENDVKQCIRYTMREKKMVIDELNVENVLESIHYKFSGCKSVYQKVSLLEASKSVIKGYL